MVRISKKLAKLLSLPTTCTWIARLHVASAKSFNSQLNSPFDLSSAVVTLEINRETLCGVVLTLNRCRKLALTRPACPFDEMTTILALLNRNLTETNVDDRLYFQFNVAEDPLQTCNLPGMSASVGFAVVWTGVGSYHVTVAPSEGEYLDRR